MDVLDGEGLDVDGVDGGGDDGVHPGDGVGGDGAVDEIIASQVALEERGSSRISFHFIGEE